MRMDQPKMTRMMLTTVLVLFLRCIQETCSDLNPTGGSFQTPLTCRDGKIQCEMDTHCPAILASVRRECQKDQACTEEKQRQCSGWQSWLRATPIFKDCHCRVTTAQKADCMDIQRSVFDDYCGNGNIIQVHQEVNESVLRKEERERIYAQYMEEAAGSGPRGAGGDQAREEGDEEEDPGEYMSCIGLRKRCLVERECRETLTDFRLHCKENKKKNVCVSTDP